MNIKVLSAISALAVGGFITGSAEAEVTYTYTGNDFTVAIAQYTTSDSVMGDFTLATPLGDNMPLTTIHPISYSFSDGVQTLNNLDSQNGFEVSTNASGAITVWDIRIELTTTLDNRIFTINVPGEQQDLGLDVLLPGGYATGYNQDSVPGTWAVSSPEPAVWLLMLSGFAGLGAALRSERRRTALA